MLHSHVAFAEQCAVRSAELYVHNVDLMPPPTPPCPSYATQQKKKKLLLYLYVCIFGIIHMAWLVQNIVKSVLAEPALFILGSQLLVKHTVTAFNNWRDKGSLGRDCGGANEKPISCRTL